VRLVTPAAPGVIARILTWGREHDTRPITTTGDLTDTKVAGYVAKYATKAAECTGTLDRRITPADRLADLPIRDHARRHIAECLRLGRLPQFTDLRLVAWAHMLGFRGHFSTKSRAYSTTMSPLRAERAAYQRESAIAAGLLPDIDGDTTLIVNHWHFADVAARHTSPHWLLTSQLTHCLRRRGEDRHDSAPADRVRGGRGLGNFSQQALRAVRGRIGSIRPYRRVPPCSRRSTRNLCR